MQLERQIEAHEDGKELKVVLKHGMKLSSAMISRLKNSHGIYVNSIPVYTNYICRTGDNIRLDISAAEPAQNVVPEHGELKIIYEDDLIIAVDKPEGMLTHPSRAQYHGSLAGYVAGYLSMTGDTSCHSLNRLDRYTSGVVLFAKNAYAKALYASAMNDAEKEYIAVAYGRFSNDRGVIDLPIKRLESGNMLRGVAEDGMRAITHYEVMEVRQQNESYMSLLRLRLETGRTHQIRVHCASIGHPLIGDQLYCSAESKVLSDGLSIHGQLLHASHLRFTSSSGTALDICSPINGDRGRFLRTIFNTAI